MEHNKSVSNNKSVSKFIHYGASKYNPRKFKKIKNISWIKPDGGLWCSRVDAEYGWSDWCKDEKFRDCTMDRAFIFNLTNDARILTIRTKDDLEGLPRNEGSWYRGSGVLLDFEKLSLEYDVIEVLAGSNRELYWLLYGWDCDSVLILNKNVIITSDDILY